MPSVSNEGRGVLPDYEVLPQPEEVAIGADSQMGFVMDLIVEEAEKQ